MMGRQAQNLGLRIRLPHVFWCLCYINIWFNQLPSLPIWKKRFSFLNHKGAFNFYIWYWWLMTRIETCGWKKKVKLLCFLRCVLSLDVILACLIDYCSPYLSHSLLFSFLLWGPEWLWMHVHFNPFSVQLSLGKICSNIYIYIYIYIYDVDYNILLLFIKILFEVI